VLDYGVRFIVIALAAWWGSRWLAQPVSRLVGAAEQLGPALAQGRPPPPLDEHHGTAEVRSAATVFNRMARQLREVFEGRGLMMAAISHDLRTPLTRLRMRLETTPLEAQFQRRSVADLAEMNALIDAVLEVFRGSGGHRAALQQVDVAALVQALVDDRAEQGEPVALQPGPGGAAAAVLPTEPLALRRIVDNLVGNALRYAGATEVVVRSTADAVEVQVLDRGPGIPTADLAAVMQPFVRLESSRNRATGGAGLGLFIARELAQRLGGTLTLGPRAGGGLQALLRLPRQP
jgi:protein-histidine pros-kinase